eukprot:1825058-Rhodomonas_salina.2
MLDLERLSSDRQIISTTESKIVEDHEPATRNCNNDLTASFETLAHTLPVEKHGLSMEDLNKLNKWDYALQLDLIEFCAEMLEDTVERNERRGKQCELRSFVGKTAPISPAQYVRRIRKHSQCSPCCLVVACIYLQRLKNRVSQTYLTTTTFQRLFAIAAMTASKYLDDHFSSNRRWADIAGLSLKELNALEVEFLFRLAFELNITREEYDEYVYSVTFGSERTTSVIVDSFKVSRVSSFKEGSEESYYFP